MSKADPLQLHCDQLEQEVETWQKRHAAIKDAYNHAMAQLGAAQRRVSDLEAARKADAMVNAEGGRELKKAQRAAGRYADAMATGYEVLAAVVVDLQARDEG